MALGSGDAIYVVAGQGGDTLAARLDSAGTVVWNATYTSVNSAGGNAAGVDTGGNLYLAGSNGDLMLMKINSSGTSLWARTWDSGKLDIVNAIAFDSAGNIVIAGGSEEKNIDNFDFMAWRYDPQGNLLNAMRLPGNLYDIANGLAVDSADALYMTGMTYTSQGRVLKTYFPTLPTPPGCESVFDVWAGTPSAINSALGAIPTSLNSETCVVVRDSATYSEQVTVQNFTSNGFRLRVLADPALSTRPIISPPPGATAAFSVLSASVSIEGFAIRPTASLSRGISVSAPHAMVSSVAIEDSGFVTNIGIGFDGGIQVGTFTGISFAPSVGVNVDASTVGAGSRVTMSSWSGSRAGSPFEVDPLQVVDWVGEPSISTGPLASVSSVSVTASWASPFPAGTLYTVQVATVGGFTSTLVTSATLNVSATVYGLTPNTTYFVRVAPNASGPFTLLGSTVTLAAPPALSALVSVTTQSVRFAWDQNGNPPGTAYQATFSTMPTFAPQTPGAWSIDATSVTISGLSPYTTYYVRVRARSRTGTASDYDVALATRTDPRPIEFTFYWGDVVGTNGPRSATWGDYDGDGDLDFAAIDDPFGSLNRVFRNDGNASFTRVWTSTAMPGSRAAAWGDYDNDGDLDLVISLDRGSFPYDPNLRLLRNDGGGAFTLVWVSTESGYAQGVAWGDYDNDGRLDLVAINDDFFSGSKTRIYRNFGNGTFGEVWAAPDGPGFKSAAWGDYDDDGRLDLIAGVQGSPAKYTRIYRNTTSGFALVWSSTQTGVGKTAQWADIDQDGRLDFLTLDGQNDRRLRYYRNDGSTFTLTTSASLSLDDALALGDIDSDGDLDAATQRFGSGSNDANNVFGNDGTGRFAPVWTSTHGFSGGSAELGDVNGDGKPDLLVSDCCSSAAPKPRIYLNVSPAPNAPPSAPVTGLSASYAAGSQTLSLRWDAGTDDKTPSAGLRYAVRAGTVPGGSGILSDAQPPQLGSFQHPQRVSATQLGRDLVLVIPGGATVYWSVRAFDGGTSRSAASSEQSVVIPPPLSTPDGCGAVLNVGQGHYGTIGAALAAAPATLTAETCVVIRDSATLSEQVTVQGFANNGYRLRILAQQGVSPLPAVSPPAGSTAAFQVRNSSVSIENLRIAITTPVAYGVLIEAPYAALSGVDLLASAAVQTAAVQLSSWGLVERSTISVQNASAIRIDGAGAHWNVVDRTSATNSAAGAATVVLGSSSNTVTGSTIHNEGGKALVISGSSNRVADSTVTARGAWSVEVTSTSNSISRSILTNFNGGAVSIDAGGDFTTITYSTITTTVESYGLQINYASTNTISDSYIWASAGETVSLLYTAGNSLARNVIAGGTIAGVRIYRSHGNTIADSFILGRSFGVALSGDSNSLVRSTITADGSYAGLAGTAVSITDAASGTVRDCHIYNSSGIALGVQYYTTTPNNITVTGSTVIRTGGSAAALSLNTVSSITVADSLVRGSGMGASVMFADRVSLLRSTFIAGGVDVALSASLSSATFLTDVYAQGFTAMQVGVSTGTVAERVHLHSSGGSGRGLELYGGNVGFTVRSSTLTGGSSGTGMDVYGSNSGTFSISSVTVRGAANGVRIGAQAAGTVWAFGPLVFEGLTGGATAVHLVSGTHVATMTGVAFLDPGLGVNVSAASVGAGSRITMRDWSGPRGGGAFEVDPLGVVDWLEAPGEAAVSTVPVTSLFTSSLTVQWTSLYPDGTSYTVQLSTLPDFTGGLLSATTTGLSSPFTGLTPNTSYYARVATSAAGPFVEFGAAVTAIEPPTLVVFEEVTATSLVASAFAPTPAFSNLSAGPSGTNVAVDGVYGTWHGERWTSKAAMPTARAYPAAANVNGKIYVLGGYAPGATALNEVYDPALDAWTTRAAMPTARFALGAASLDGRVHAVGGENPAAAGLAAHEVYDPASDAWTTKADLPLARYELAAAGAGGQVYALGGWNAGMTARVDGYDPAADEWTLRTPMAGNRRGLAAVASGGKVYALGGGNPSYSRTNEQYDPALNVWTLKAPMPTERQWMGAAALGGKIYVLGGNWTGESYRTTNEEYDPVSDTWTARAPLASGRRELAAASSGGRLYVLGGYASGGPLASNEEYDPGVARLVTGLQPNKLYSFKARARNRLGVLSPESPTAFTVTLATASPPLAGTQLVSAPSASSVTVNWSSGTGSGQFNYFNATYVVETSTSALFQPVAASSTTRNIFATLPGPFNPGATYYFRVKPINSLSVANDWAVLGSSVVLYGPSLPLYAAPFSDVSASVIAANWTTSLPDGTPFLAQLSTASDFSGTLASSATFGTSARFEGLASGTTYHARVATAAAGPFLALGSTVTMQAPSPGTLIRSSRSGLWSSSGTWDAGVLPTRDFPVTILAGHAVTVDLTGAEASTLTVRGTLSFSRVANSTLTLVGGDAVVESGGTLDLGTAADPIAGVRAQLVLPLGTAARTYSLTVQEGSRFFVHGAPKVPYGAALGDLAPGATSVLMRAADVSGWAVGDEITLGNTETSAADQTERRTVTGISGTEPKTVSWAGGLAYSHAAARPLMVANLTRTVVVRSSGTVRASNTAYVLSAIRTLADCQVRYGEFAYLGRWTGGGAAAGYSFVLFGLGGGAKAAVSSSTFREGAQGVYSMYGTGSSFVGNLIYKNDTHGLFIDAFGPGQDIVNNLIFANGFPSGTVREPLFNRDTNSARYVGNYIFGNRHRAVQLSNASGLLLSGNHIFANGGGITFYDGSGVTVSSNTIHRNASTGILLSGLFGTSTDSVFAANLVHSNSGEGVYLYSQSRNHRFVGNMIYGNTSYGLRVRDDLGSVFVDGRLGYDAEGASRQNGAAEVHFEGSAAAALTLRRTRVNPVTGISTAGFSSSGRYLASYLQDDAAGTLRVWGAYAVSGSTLTLDHAARLYAASAGAPRLLRGTGHSLSVSSASDANAVDQLVSLEFRAGQWHVDGSAGGPDLVPPFTGAQPALDVPATAPQVRLNFTPGGSPAEGDRLEFVLLAASPDAGVPKKLLVGPAAAAFNGGRSRLEFSADSGFVLRGIAGSPAVLDRLDASATYYTFVDSGAFTVQWASVTNMDSGGLQLSGTRGVSISSTTFDQLGFTAATSAYVTARDLTSSAVLASVGFALSRSSPSGAFTYNVRVSGADSGLAWTFAPGVPAGGLWGAGYEHDPNGRVDWAGVAVPAPPSAPVPFVLGASSISWAISAAGDADSYRFVSASTGGLLATVSTGTFLQTGLGPNTTQAVAVSAVRASSVSTLSPGATAYTHALPPAALAAVVSGSSVVVTWSLNGNPPGTTAELQTSTDGTLFATRFLGPATSYAYGDLFSCATRHFRLRNRNWAGVATDFERLDAFLIGPSSPLPAGDLSAESLPGSRIRLTWVSSPDPGLSGYRLYYDSGTGTVDYSAPLAPLGAASTVYTTGPLANGVVYRFGLRARNGCGREEGGLGSVAAAPALGSLSGVRSAIKVPASGKRVSGNRVLVMAELVSGEPERTREVRFQYRASSAAAWTDVPAANLQHPNPDSAQPYFVHWDVTGLPPADFDLRAVATDVFGSSDAAPGLISVSVDPVNFEVRETDQGGGRVKKEQTVNNAVPNTLAAAESGSAVVTKVMIPAGAVSASTTVVTLQVNPVGAPPHASDALPVGVTLEVNLGNGQSLLAGGQTAALVFNYPDSDGDGVVDGSTLRAAKLSIVTYDAQAGRWKQEFAAEVDQTARTVTGRTSHFSFFSLIGAAAANLSAATVYPNPWKPNGGNPDEGKGYVPGDATSGVVFDNLPASVRVTIYTLDGTEVESFGTEAGTGALQWDGRNSSGQDVASGVYFAVIKSPGSEPLVLKFGVVR